MTDPVITIDYYEYLKLVECKKELEEIKAVRKSAEEGRNFSEYEGRHRIYPATPEQSFTPGTVTPTT